MMSKHKESISYWKFIHKDSNGRILNETKFIHNQSIMEGLLYFQDISYGAVNYTAEWYIGLAGPGIMTPDIHDLASTITTGIPNPPTTNDWAEFTGYNESTRRQCIFSDANLLEPDFISVGVDNSANPCVFTINTSSIIQGGFMINQNTKGGTTGKLFAVDDGAGALVVSPGNTISVIIVSGLFNGPE